MATSIHLMIAVFISCYITAKQVSSRLEKRGHINIALNVWRYAYMKTCAWYSFLYLKIITQIPFFFLPNTSLPPPLVHSFVTLATSLSWFCCVFMEANFATKPWTRHLLVNLKAGFHSSSNNFDQSENLFD